MTTFCYGNLSVDGASADAVGIGTVSPGGELEVFAATNQYFLFNAGAATFRNSTNSNTLNIESVGTTGTASIQFATNITGSSQPGRIDWHQISGDTNRFAFSPNGTEKVSLDENGLLGIGDTTPDYLLELFDATNTPEFALSDDDVLHGLTTIAETDVFSHLSSLSTTDGGVLWTGISDTDAEAINIRGVIGSTDPTDNRSAVKIVGAKSNGSTGIADLGDEETVFAVANNNNGNVFVVMGDGQIGIGPGATIPGISLAIEDANSGINNPDANAGSLDFYIDNGIAMTIDQLSNNRNVGIGIQTPISKLHIQTSGLNGKSLLVLNQTEAEDIFTASASGTTRLTLTNGGLLDVNADTNADAEINLSENGTVQWNIYNDGDNADRLYITDNDNDNGVYIAQDATAWTANSDIRLKENLVQIDNVLDKLSSINAYTYNFIGTDRTEIGVIAQDIQLAFPELVETDKDGYLGVSYSRLAPILISAVNELNSTVTSNQELVTSNEEQNTRYTELETRVSDLELLFTDYQLPVTSTSSASFTDLTVSGEAVLGDVTITGVLQVGTTIIDGFENSIDAVGVLKLQPLALGGIELLGGKVQIDIDGNILIAEGVIKGNEQFRDAATLPANEAEIRIERDWSSVGLPVTINANADYFTNVIIKDIDKTGFVIEVETTPETDSIVHWSAIW